MSPSTARFVIWSAMLAALPLPWLLVEPASGPVVRMLQLACWLVAVALAEGDWTASAPLAALAMGQALVWMGLCWLGAGWTVRALGHHRRLLLAVASVWLAVLACGAALAWPVFGGDIGSAAHGRTLVEVLR